MAETKIKNTSTESRGVKTVNGWAVLDAGETRTVTLAADAVPADLKKSGVVIVEELRPEGDDKTQAPNKTKTK